MIVVAATSLVVTSGCVFAAEASAAAAPAAPARAADTAGSVPVGSARYAVPAGAVIVSPWGRDAANGTIATPVATITRALVLAPDGGTIVLRAGTYHESVSILTKRVTIQNYPGEAAWLDGSSTVSGWVAQGSVWRKDGWAARFDHSPTYTKGAPDSSTPNWSFVSPAYPMAAHPDQVWIDGVALQQVSSLAQVKPGTFYLNEGTSQLYTGSNPNGHQVRATDIAKAISVRTAGTVLRGFGVRRFGPSVWMMGSITLEKPSISVSNLEVDDMATTGISSISDNITLDHVTVQRAGMLGLHASGAYNLKLLSVKSSQNNTERFNTAPVSGGFKIGRSRGLLIKDSSFTGNLGPGFWADQSVYDMSLIGNNVNDNQGAAVFLEISAKALLVDNLISGNTGDGVKVNNTSDVRIWNNTIIKNGRTLDIVSDSRLASNTSWGHDPRQPFQDPTMTWLLGPVTVRNNVLGLPQSGNCILCVEDYTHRRTADQIGVSSNGNLYNRLSPSQPSWLAVWSRGSANPNPAVLNTLTQFVNATGQDRNSVAFDNGAVVSASGQLSGAGLSSVAKVAQALPADVGAAAGVAAGTRWLGVWGR